MDRFGHPRAQDIASREAERGGARGADADKNQEEDKECDRGQDLVPVALGSASATLYPVEASEASEGLLAKGEDTA